MGNCLKKESTSEWGGEEMEFLNPTPALAENESRRMRRSANKSKKVHFDANVEVFGGGYQEAEELEGESAKGEMEQVKIRITKRELEELLGKIELDDLSAHEMLTSLIIQQHLRNKLDDDQTPWRPVLSAIPEFSDLD